MEYFKSSMLDLVVQTSTNLPPDARAAMAEALAQETPGSQAASAVGIIATNIDMAYACAGRHMPGYGHADL